MLSIDELSLFERQPGEPARAYHGFAHYRDLGPMRSLDKAWREHHEKCLQQVQPATRRRPMSWGDWSVRWGWVERAAAYDASIEKQKRAALLDEQLEASRRHARVLQAAISTVTVPVRIALETASTPAGLDALRTSARASASGLRTALAEARLSAVHLPQLIVAERLVLGLTTESHELREGPFIDNIADRITSSPAATSAAVELVNQIAQLPSKGE